MAVVLEGINGAFSGKVGTVVGYKWKGKAVMRGLPNFTNRKFSPLQIQQHAKFSIMNLFLKPLIPLLNETFNAVAVQMTGYNKAFSYNVKNAVTGSLPEIAINYNMVLLGRGDLPNVETVAVQSSSPGELTFSWKDNTGTGIADSSDNAFLAVYCQELSRWHYQMNVAVRAAAGYIMKVPEFSGKTVHSYIGFISADGKEVSDSIYSGPANVL